MNDDVCCHCCLHWTSTEQVCRETIMSDLLNGTGLEAMRVPVGWEAPRFQDSRHFKVVTSALSIGRLNPTEISLVLISVRGWDDPKAIVRQERLCQWKIPVTPSGIETATFRLVTQCLNQLLGGSSGRSKRVWKISLSPGLDPRTVQPIQTGSRVLAMLFRMVSYSRKKGNGILRRVTELTIQQQLLLRDLFVLFTVHGPQEPHMLLNTGSWSGYKHIMSLAWVPQLSWVWTADAGFLCYNKHSVLLKLVAACLYLRVFDVYLTLTDVVSYFVKST